MRARRLEPPALEDRTPSAFLAFRCQPRFAKDSEAIISHVEAEANDNSGSGRWEMFMPIPGTLRAQIARPRILIVFVLEPFQYRTLAADLLPLALAVLVLRRGYLGSRLCAERAVH